MNKLAKNEWAIGAAIGTASMGAAALLHNNHSRHQRKKTSKRVKDAVAHPVETKDKLEQEAKDKAKQKIIKMGRNFVRKRATEAGEKAAENLRDEQQKASTGVESKAQDFRDKLQEGLKKAKQKAQSFADQVHSGSSDEHRIKGANDLKGANQLKRVNQIKTADDIKHIK